MTFRPEDPDMRHRALLYLIHTCFLLTACGNPKCMDGERKVGVVCYSLDKKDAAVDAGEPRDGAVRPPSSDASFDASASEVREASSDAAPFDAVTDSAAGAEDAAESTGVPGPCTATGLELCGDHVDNDCDGETDEAVAELCNGLDDDCDPATSDGAGACGTYVCKDAACLKTCGVDSDCVAGLHCARGSCEGTQTGAACASDSQCASGSCGVANKCTDKVGLNGGCDTDPDCSAGSCSAGVCKKASGSGACATDDECASGICVSSCFATKRDVGQSCDTPSDCATSLACVGGSCKRNLATSCGVDSECISGSCAPAGTCAAPAAYAQPCNSAPDCGVGLVCSTTTCKRALGQACVDDPECGEGTCAPDAVILTRRACRQLGGLYSTCDNDTDCGQHIKYRFTCSKQRCLVGPDDICTSTAECAGYVCTCEGCADGICD